MHTKGKKMMAPAPCVDFHPFTKTLHEWENGVPANCGLDWTWDTVETAVKRGPHKSALTPEAMSVMKTDVACQVKSGCANVHVLNEMCRLKPKTSKIHPLALVPQRN